MAKETLTSQSYADELSVQLRKGFLAYCMLRVCSHEPVYTSDIIQKLHSAELVVVEGTVYPLLSRLQRDGLLTYRWRESEMGPPRKYYAVTDYGREVMENMKNNITKLNNTLEKL